MSHVWKDWYTDHSGVSPAKVTFDLKCTSSGYSNRKNLIIVSLGEGNLDNHDILNKEDWPAWKQQLIHEMLHEYEMKAIREPSKEGKALHAKYSALHSSPLAWGSLHSESFYTAVCDKAPYFGLTPEKLLGYI